MPISRRALLPSAPQPPAAQITPFDLFILVNLGLFAAMCVFTYYARFIEYRGAANIWEFFVYAAVIVLVIAGAWMVLRQSAFSARVLLLVQAGILAHFAGAFVHWDGQRLYDHVWLGVRYDKVVHLLNAFVAVRGVAHLCERRGLRVAGVGRILVGLSVLGLGAIVEIVEYIVMLTIPGNGVGGYDNNMQDLIANGIGTLASVLTLGESRRLVVVTSRPESRTARTPLVSVLELMTLTLGTLAAVWFGPVFLSRWAYAVAGVSLGICASIYTIWLAPTRIHHDTLEMRGLGNARHWFVRLDNLRAASRPFVMLTLAGTIGILLLAEWRNPGWAGRANWEAWAVRLLAYSLSASLQAVVFVGFVLVRLKEIFGRRLAVAVAAGIVFGAMHAPDPLLIVLTMLFGFAVAWISVETPNVLAAAGCQLVLGFLVHRTLEVSLRVGYFHTHRDYYMFRELLPPLRWLIGDLY